ncbi:MBL fold metallo-hydrolase [Reinekea forsetii]|nr:MBL fold metallo-hydrolase [Reinekea forsetii]
MIADVVRLFIPNSALNYNHLVVCPDSRKAAIVDPFNADLLFNFANEQNLEVEQIWITHEHPDHIKDLAPLQTLTNAHVYAPETCRGKFDADTWLKDNQTITLGNCAISHLLTPGHTPGHGIYWQRDHWAIFGDTVFNAGIGNTKSGDATELYHTVQRLKHLMTDTVKVYTGHDYIETNLKFTLQQKPNLESAARLLEQVSQQTPDTRLISNWAQEKEINLFLNAPDREAFIELRALRDKW